MKTKSPIVRVLRDALGAISDPIRRFRHASELRHAEITPAEKALAAASWWGNDKRWYQSGYPPRKHNTITPLIDGEVYFAAVGKALNEAERYIFISAWILAPNFPLSHPEEVLEAESSSLVNILARAAERGVAIRILIWNGARLARHPTQDIIDEMIAKIKEQAPNADIIVLFDHAAKITHTIHEKSLSIDGHIGFVSGMDFTTLEGDRWDTTHHPFRRGQNWHDAGFMLEGEIALDLDDHIRKRFLATEVAQSLPSSSLPAPLPKPAIRHTQQAQLVMTMPRRIYPFEQDGEYSVLHVYLEAIRAAKHFIYIENQFLWSPYITDALEDAIKRNQDKPFRIVVLLPAEPDAGKLDNDQHIESLRNFDESEAIFHAFTLYTSGVTAGQNPFKAVPIYLHAKLMIVDDEWVTIGSANLNDRGLIRDVELNVVLKNPKSAKALRIALWAEHLHLPESEIAQLSPVDCIDFMWLPHATKNKELLEEGNVPLLSAVHRYETGHMPGTWLLQQIEDVVIEH